MEIIKKEPFLIREFEKKIDNDLENDEYLSFLETTRDVFITSFALWSIAAFLIYFIL
ncbi:hypothetical protein [Bacillus cereus]|uniref:hypothetical protein n=1 Tax=Bacillus cereus TaxID=1396 RepID=UPI00187941AA|nr:hypothetical protein [Bacillus cereus]